jgi:DNA-binding protein
MAVSRRGRAAPAEAALGKRSVAVSAASPRGRDAELAALARLGQVLCPMSPANDPLHGITLEALLTELVSRHGFEELALRVNIRCFSHEPSIKSSLKFLRRTEWARTAVEQLYLADQELLARKRQRNQERAARRAYAAARGGSEPSEEADAAAEAEPSEEADAAAEAEPSEQAVAEPEELRGASEPVESSDLSESLELPSKAERAV